MISTLGNMFDDTIALTRIILSGLLDQHPRLKLVSPHLGGTLPFIIGRLDHQISVLKRGPKVSDRGAERILRQVYLDIASPLAASDTLAADLVGVERLPFSSDHPWVSPKLILDSLRGVRFVGRKRSQDPLPKRPRGAPAGRIRSVAGSHQFFEMAWLWHKRFMTGALREAVNDYVTTPSSLKP